MSVKEDFMLVRSSTFRAGTLVAAMFAAHVSTAHALTMKECSAKYRAAQEAGTLSGTKWNDFRKAECGADASAAPTNAPAAGAAPAAASPTPTPTTTTAVPDPPRLPSVELTATPCFRRRFHQNIQASPPARHGCTLASINITRIRSAAAMVALSG